MEVVRKNAVRGAVRGEVGVRLKVRMRRVDEPRIGVAAGGGPGPAHLGTPPGEPPLREERPALRAGIGGRGGPGPSGYALVNGWTCPVRWFVKIRG